METLTSYKDAETILNQLKDEDVKDIRLIYKGWFNGGVNHDFPTKIELDEGVGNKKQLSNLIEYLNRNNISLYPDVAFGTVYRQGNGFKASKDAALYMTQKTAKIYNYNLATYMQETDEIKGYVLSPLRLPNLVNKFMPKFKEYGFENIAIRDLGNELNSDFNENRVVNREQNKEIIQEQLEAMKKGCKDILVNGGNAYTLPYTKNIVNLPTEYSNFNILDESIPFYQIVLHGYIDYAGKPLNYDIDAGYKKKLLKILETGSGVSYQWIYQDPSLFKETEFDYMYSAYYKDWIEEGIDIYKEANKVLGDLEGQRIESHKKLENNVYETIYENGTKIIVNYNNHGIKVENHFIEAEDYWVGGE